MRLSPPPPGRWQRAFYVPLTILAWFAVAIVVLWLLGHVSHTVLLIVLASVVAFALAPLVALFRRWLSRPLAIGLAYIAGVGIVVGLSLLLVVTAAQQVSILVQNLPSYAQQVQNIEPQIADRLGPLGVTPANLQSFNQQLFGAAQQVGTTVAAGSLGIVSRVVEDIVDAVLILILSIYFLLGGPRVAAWLRAATPERLLPATRLMIRTVNQVIGGYVRGTLTMAALIGVLVGVGLGILGVPFAVLLGLLAFFMEFVPVIGVLISGAVSLLVTLPRGPGITIVVLIYFIIVHIIESDIVGPRVMGRAVGIHPAVGIIALLAGSELFGVWGALFAAPLAGLLQAAITAAWRVATEGGVESLATVGAEKKAEVEQEVKAIESDEHEKA